MLVFCLSKTAAFTCMAVTAEVGISTEGVFYIFSVRLQKRRACKK
jgi:hypothetical protein